MTMIKKRQVSSRMLSSKNLSNDVQALFQIPKHRSYKGDKPSLTPSSLEVGVSLLFGEKKPHF